MTYVSEDVTTYLSIKKKLVKNATNLSELRNSMTTESTEHLTHHQLITDLLLTGSTYCDILLVITNFLILFYGL